MKPLTDTDQMPFGKYQGRKMQDVPADYLHWLFYHGLQGDPLSPVAAYIHANKAALELETPDLIWD